MSQHRKSHFWSFELYIGALNYIDVTTHWWARMDSNHRPLTYKISALTPELLAQKAKFKGLTYKYIKKWIDFYTYGEIN